MAVRAISPLVPRSEPHKLSVLSGSPLWSCRGCGHPLQPDDVFCDLGAQPLANNLLESHQLREPEPHYPLRPLVCSNCLLVQLPVAPNADQIFTDHYPFFAGQSLGWVRHCRHFAEEMSRGLGLGATSRVLDIGSNDGTMLRRFRGKGIPAIGVEPCLSVAQHATMEGLPTLVDWWGTSCAQRLQETLGEPTGKSWLADLVIATNVAAHVPDLNDFLCGIAEILAPGGMAVIEVAYVGDLIAGSQIDQIYAEHLNYFSVHSLTTALEIANLAVVDVQHLPTHGGSLRVFAQRSGEWLRESLLFEDPSVSKETERFEGLNKVETYKAFAKQAPKVKRGAWYQIVQGAPGVADPKVIGYGASAKATVMLNYCGLGGIVQYVADTTPVKQGKWIPGVRIPVRRPAPDPSVDIVVNFAWNWREEAEANIREMWPQAKIVYLNS